MILLLAALREIPVSLTVAAWRVMNRVVPNAMIRRQKCVVRIPQPALWAKIAWRAAVVQAAKFVVEPATNAIIRKTQYAVKETELCGPVLRVLLVAALEAAMMKPRKFAAPTPAHVPSGKIAFQVDVVLAVRLLAEAISVIIRTLKNVASPAVPCGLVPQIFRAAPKLAVVTMTLCSVVLVGAPAPKKISVVKTSVVFQLLIVDPMGIAQDRLLHRHALLLRRKHHSALAHQNYRLQQVVKPHVCHPRCPLLLQQMIQAITSWLMATACLSWTLSMSMASQKS